MNKLVYILMALSIAIGISSCNRQPNVVTPIDVPNVDSLKTYVDKAAKTNDPLDQYFAANYYLKQYTVSDSIKAIELLTKSASQNFPSAANMLGEIYSADSTMSHYDIHKAVEYYELGVKNGSDEAMSNLADLLIEGREMEPDYERALQLRADAMLGLLSLAKHGDAAAQQRLGVKLADGIGVAENKTAGLVWIKKAANQGYIPAYYSMGIFYRDGKGGLKADSKEAFNYFQKSADKGFRSAMLRVAEAYATGKGTDINLPKAFEYYLKAAKLGDIDAMFAVALAYQFGNGVGQNYGESFKWNKLCAERGHINAQNNIGSMYYSGNGVAQNYQEAFKWFMKAANQGSAFSQRVVGDCYYEGTGVEKDLAKAFEWYIKSAQGGDKLGMNRLARCYLTGEGVPVDEALAMYWLRQSE